MNKYEQKLKELEPSSTNELIKKYTSGTIHVPTLWAIQRILEKRGIMSAHGKIKGTW